MSRRQPIEQLIDDYKEKKTEADNLKKSADKLNLDIKNYLINHNMDSASSDKWTAKISKNQRETLDDDKAIAVLKENLSEDDLAKVIKTKEYIDDGALEDLAYHNKINLNILEPCRVLGKEIITLRISKKK